MNKHEAIQHHQALVAKRNRLIHSGEFHSNVLRDEAIKEIDKQIGRYGNVHNPKITKKAAQYIGL